MRQWAFGVRDLHMTALGIAVSLAVMHVQHVVSQRQCGWLMSSNSCGKPVGATGPLIDRAPGDDWLPSQAVGACVLLQR